MVNQKLSVSECSKYSSGDLSKEIYNILSEFFRTLDIAKAGRRIYSLARKLRLKAEKLLGYKGQKRVGHMVKTDSSSAEIVLSIEPTPYRAPSRRRFFKEFLEAKKVIEEKLEVKPETFEFKLLNLAREIERIYISLVQLVRSTGRSKFEFSTLMASMQTDKATLLISLLHLDNEGKILLIQKKLYDPLYIEFTRNG